MDIDVSKENIQPLRGGRNLTQLGTALQAQSDHDAQRQLQLQKEEHEAAVANYQGSDPLDPWFNYIQWVEQSFPKHGHEGHIDKLIKDCLQLFEKDDRYFQDRRYVKLWIKYIDSRTNPLEIYQSLYNSGIGVECSEFYRAWACYCEESGDYKKANQVYMMGLQAHAQPLDELEQAHMNFQLFFAQRMLHDDSPTKRKAASALAETRMALTSLKSFKRRNIANAPIQRIGENVRSFGPGVVSQHSAYSDRRSNTVVNVYEDVPSTSHVPGSSGETPGPSSLVQSLNNVENEKEVGIWTNAKTKMVYTNVVPHQNLPFTPYEDEDDLKLSANHVPYCKDDLQFTVALCLPDPPDATKIPCYNKEQVYVDKTEYSLEEIKARNYQLKQKVKTENQESVDILVDQNSEEQAAQCSALETLANCALDAEQDHLSHLMPLSVPAIQNIKIQNIHSPGEPKVLVNLDSKEFSELANPSLKKEENRQPFSVKDKANQAERPISEPHSTDNSVHNLPRPHLAEEFNKSLMNNLWSDSLTINTKEARWELRNIFNGNATESSIVQPVACQFEAPVFDVHEDHSTTMALKKKQVVQNVIESSLPENKENEKFTVPVPQKLQNVNKTTYCEEAPSCTQVFNFNINDASTPNISQFKKPTSYGEQIKMTVPKFSIDESTIEHGTNEVPIIKTDESSRCDGRGEHHPIRDIQDLSVIMEATREYNSKSGSNSSGRQSTRTNFTGYTTTPYSEKTQGSNYESMYNQQNEQTVSKRTSVSTQPRLPNGQFARVYPQKNNSENKVGTPSGSVPYLSHDHQYQKPVPLTYNGYTAQRSIQNQGYQQNFGVSYQQGYVNSQMGNQQTNIQQGYPSPSYQSPQHTMQSPHHVQSPAPTQTGFQSPPHAYAHQQVGYHSPGQQVQNSPQHYPNAMMRQDYTHVQTTYTNQDQRHVYANPPHSPAAFQSPPHQSQYTNAQYYQRTNLVSTPTNSVYAQQNYSVQNQYNMTNAYENQDLNQQSFNAAQNQYRHQPMQMAENVHRVAYGVVINNASFQIPVQPSHNSYQVSENQNTIVLQNKCQPMVTSPSQQKNISKDTSLHLDRYDDQETNDRSMQNLEAQKMDVRHSIGNKQNTSGNQTVQLKSPTSALRNIRHEQSHAKTSHNSADVGFSSQFLNFISGRNEPKDNANTPKFNSPNISQKMHKNLYVSSPEQAQIPPSTGHSDSESKDGFMATTITPIQSAKVSSQGTDKQKDVSKRQLDFEQRMEVQSEDSRDSIGKESRISSVYSRQSDFQSDGYGMDIDSENSMECAAYKSTHSISQIETSDIARPADIDFPQIIDPFNKKVINSLLEYVKFPNKTHAEGYIEVRSVPKLQIATLFSVGGYRFSIEKQLGKGNYGAVFLCLDMVNNKSVAVKYQKPSRPWEFYICQEIKARIKDPFMLPGYMDITTAFLGDNASLFISEYSKYGSLLDVANKVRLATSKCIHESVVFLLTSEMLSIIHYLHKAQIIHADIKPDNFLLMKIPTQEWRTPSLQLIDLGCAIDMSLFPEGTTFRELIATEGFTCTEMREGRPWTYQTDLYCLAGTIHVILLGSYMKVVNRLGQWNIDKKLPRYMKAGLWDKIFTTLLNIPDCNTLPDLMDLKSDVDNLLCNLDNLGSQLRTLANVLKSR